MRVAFANDITGAAVNTRCVFVKSSQPYPLLQPYPARRCVSICSRLASSEHSRLNSVSKRLGNRSNCSSSVMQSGVSGTIKQCELRQNGSKIRLKSAIGQQPECARDRLSKNAFSSLPKYYLHGFQRLSSCIARCVTHRMLRCCKSLNIGLC